MKKKVLRIITLFLICILMLSCVAYAAINASEYINVTSAWITRDGGSVQVHFYILGTDTMDQIGVKYIYLYEKNGNVWSLKKVFNYTDPLYTSTMMGTNSAVNSGNVSYSGSADKQYYATCWFYAEKNGGSDTITQNAY